MHMYAAFFYVMYVSVIIWYVHMRVCVYVRVFMDAGRALIIGLGLLGIHED